MKLKKAKSVLQDNLKKHPIFIILLLISFIIQLFLISSNRIPLTIQDVELLMGAKSLPLISGEFSTPVISFYTNTYQSLFPIPTAAMFVFNILLPHKLLVTKFVHLVVGFAIKIALYILATKAINYFKLNIKALPFMSIIILLSPWAQYLSLFAFRESLSLLFSISSLILVFYYVEKRNNNYVLSAYLLLLIAGLCSWAGLFTAPLAGIVILFLHKSKNKSKEFAKLILYSLVLFVPLVINTLINSGSIIKYLKQGSLYTSVLPSNLALQINERQKVDYLSSNKQFILPLPIRKFTYNKLFLATDITLKKAVSIFDFEQLSSPLDSYDEIRLSGILPKGNLPLHYLWEIPVILLGLFLTVKRFSKNQWLFVLFLIPLFPILIIEKKYMFTSGALMLVMTLLFEMAGINALINTRAIISEHAISLKPFLWVFLTLVLISAINFNHIFYFQPSRYQTSDLSLHLQISDWIAKNSDEYENIFVTNRFGPTNLTTHVYLDLDAQKYWGSVVESENNERFVVDNYTFTQINPNVIDKNSRDVFIAFPGEFYNSLEVFEAQGTPDNFRLVTTLTSEDELVYRFGNDLLVVKYND